MRISALKKKFQKKSKTLDKVYDLSKKKDMNQAFDDVGDECSVYKGLEQNSNLTDYFYTGKYKLTYKGCPLFVNPDFDGTVVLKEDNVLVMISGLLEFEEDWSECWTGEEYPKPHMSGVYGMLIGDEKHPQGNRSYPKMLMYNMDILHVEDGIYDEVITIPFQVLQQAVGIKKITPEETEYTKEGMTGARQLSKLFQTGDLRLLSHSTDFDASVECELVFEFKGKKLKFIRHAKGYGWEWNLVKED